MKTRRGNIYKFRYNKYRKDPTPIILVLWADSKVVHGINFNYLKTKLSDRLIRFIMDVSMKKIPNYGAYKLYHNYIKLHLPKIVGVAYRTYKPEHIKSVHFVLQAFNVEGFLKNNFGMPEKKIFKLIKSQVKSASGIKLNGLTQGEIERRSQKFIDLAKSIYTPKLDRSKYTFPHNKK